MHSTSYRNLLWLKLHLKVFPFHVLSKHLHPIKVKVLGV